MSYPEFIGYADELEVYNFIRIERHRKDSKQNLVSLRVDLGELLTELDEQDRIATSMWIQARLAWPFKAPLSQARNEKSKFIALCCPLKAERSLLESQQIRFRLRKPSNSEQANTHTLLLRQDLSNTLSSFKLSKI